jgi:hypothetical protein
VTKALARDPAAALATKEVGAVTTALAEVAATAAPGKTTVAMWALALVPTWAVATTTALVPTDPEATLCAPAVIVNTTGAVIDTTPEAPAEALALNKSGAATRAVAAVAAPADADRSMDT